MNLPKLSTPTYEATLPISGQKIKFRPFLVKEQKILMMTLESGDNDFTDTNVKQIISNCCLTELKIDDLSPIDIEYFFIQLRARSIGEIVETRYRCENQITPDTRCGNLMEVGINLLDIEVSGGNNANTVELTPEVGLKLKYPDFKSLANVKEDSDILGVTFEIIYNCLDYIYDENNFYYPKETPKQEIMEFLESLSLEQFKKVEEYFSNLPTLSKLIEVKCNKCGFEHKITINGLQSFLD